MKIIDNMKEQETKTYSKNIDLNCDYLASVFLDENLEIFCKIKNNGNVMLENLKICLDDKCQKTDLGITQIKNISFIIIKKAKDS